MAKVVRKAAKVTKGEDVKPISTEHASATTDQTVHVSAAEEGEVRKTVLKAEKRKPKFNQPGTNNQKTEIIE